MTEGNRERIVVAFLLHSAAPVLGGPGRQGPTIWLQMGMKHLCCDAGRMKAGNQNPLRQMCMRMLEMFSTGPENRGKKVGSSKSQMCCFLDKTNFSAVSDSSYLGGSCFVAANEKSCLASGHQHSYLIYQWKFWGNGESLLESRSAIQQTVFPLHATENPRKIWSVKEIYFVYPDLLNHTRSSC